MKSLFIDSSRKKLSVILYNNDTVEFSSDVESYSKHSNYLMNEIKRGLDLTNTQISDIDNFIVLNGPGSFTGIRIGVTVAKTLSWVLNKKLFVLSNLEALTPGINDDIIISVIYDKDDNSYVGIYHGGTKTEGYLSIDDDLLNIKDKNITLVSLDKNNYLLKLYDLLNKENNKVSLNILEDYDYNKVINLALSKNNINPHLAKPIYLKKIDAEKKN